MNEELEKFSLKDELFNEKKVTYLASLFFAVNKDFNQKTFVKEVVKEFPNLELKERIYHIRDILKKHLDMITDGTFESNLEIIMSALPEELDPTKTDDDFGDFILAPLGHFVAKHGCKREHLEKSFLAMEEMNKRFSTEFEIRDFFNAFEEETLRQIHSWSTHENYHVRRIASEGSRAKLPWAKKINLDYKKTIPVLNNLYSDNTRYVTRSVANHLNDISKIDPSLVVTTLKRWKKEGGQDAEEMIYIINHSLRTLIKQGNEKALELLGFSPNPEIELKKLKIKDRVLEISKMKQSLSKNKSNPGQSLEFIFEITSQSSRERNQNLLIDYIIHFQNKSGKTTPKVFKLKKTELESGYTLYIEKKHPLRIMSTKKIYPGEHLLEIQINGKIFVKRKFAIK